MNTVFSSLDLRQALADPTASIAAELDDIVADTDLDLELELDDHDLLLLDEPASGTDIWAHDADDSNGVVIDKSVFSESQPSPPPLARANALQSAVRAADDLVGVYDVKLKRDLDELLENEPVAASMTVTLNLGPAPTAKRRRVGRPRKRVQVAADHCTCKNSRCLKMYCVCFTAGRACGPSCSCHDCRNHTATAPKATVTFCKCTKRQCQTGYCPCFKAGRPCGPQCRKCGSNNCLNHY